MNFIETATNDLSGTGLHQVEVDDVRPRKSSSWIRLRRSPMHPNSFSWKATNDVLPLFQAVPVILLLPVWVDMCVLRMSKRRVTGVWKNKATSYDCILDVLWTY